MSHNEYGSATNPKCQTDLGISLHRSGTSSKSLLMYSDDDGETWNRFLEYNGGLHAVEIISQSVENTDKLFISILSGGKRNLYQISV
jgi:hypothetical protein